MAELEETVSRSTSDEDDKPKLDSLGRAYSTGKRKDAVARVWIKKGSGQITVNKKPVERYFARPTLRMIELHGRYERFRHIYIYILNP